MNREIIGQFIRWAMGRDATVFFQDDGLGKIHISIPYVTAGGNVISIEPGPFALGRGMGKTMRKVVQSLVQWTASFNSNDYMVKKLRETGTAMDVRELLEDMDRAMEDLEQSVWKMNHLMEALVHGLDLIYGGQGRHPESDGLIHVVSHKRAHQFLEAWLWWEEYRIMSCPVGQAPLRLGCFSEIKRIGLGAPWITGRESAGWSHFPLPGMRWITFLIKALMKYRDSVRRTECFGRVYAVYGDC